MSLPTLYNNVTNALSATTNSIIKFPKIDDLTPTYQFKDDLVPPDSHHLHSICSCNFDSLALTLSTFLSNTLLYGLNAPLSKCRMTSSITSDGFSMLEELLRSLIPSLDGVYNDPDDLIKSLTLKNKENIYSFHTRAIEIQNQLKLTNSSFGPNKLITRYLQELCCSSNIKDYVKREYSNLLKSLQKFVKSTQL